MATSASATTSTSAAATSTTTTSTPPIAPSAASTPSATGGNEESSEAIDGAWQRFLPTLRGLPFEAVIGASAADIDQLLRDSSLSLIDRAVIRTSWLRKQQAAAMTNPSSSSSSPAAATHEPAVADPYYYEDDAYTAHFHPSSGGAAPALPGSWNDSLPQQSWPPSLPYDRAGRYQMFLAAASQPRRSVCVVISYMHM